MITRFKIIYNIYKIRLNCGIPTSSLFNWICYCWPFIWNGTIKVDKVYTWEQLEEFSKTKNIC
jgi:hypothetical protein